VKVKQIPGNFKRIRFIHIGWLLLFLLLAGVVKTAVAQVTPITFTGFTGAGFAPTPAAGQLDSDLWRVTGLSDGAGTFGGTYVPLATLPVALQQAA
jgi:hypothetical protein